MNDMITVVICYAAGTERVLRTCLSSLGRHDAGAEFGVKVYTDQHGLQEAAICCAAHRQRLQILPELVGCPDGIAGSKKHGFLLDEVMRREKGLVLTLDSDCFPVAGGWLSNVWDFHKAGIVLPGILWPWEPPDPRMDKDSIEWRVRHIQNWTNTWVACQLVDVEFVKDHKLSYITGDDTGFSLIEKANELGLCMKGFMPTRCASPTWASGFDPEMNRHMCVIYDDRMIHLGGGSSRVGKKEFEHNHLFEEPIEMTLRKASADWLMNSNKAHHYRFDNETEVAAFKMRMMNSGIMRHLQNHESIF